MSLEQENDIKETAVSKKQNFRVPKQSTVDRMSWKEVSNMDVKEDKKYPGKTTDFYVEMTKHSKRVCISNSLVVMNFLNKEPTEAERKIQPLSKFVR